MRAFSTTIVAEGLGVSRRQLQYWATTGLVSPAAETPGGHRRYGISDVIRLKTVVVMRKMGVSIPAMRPAIEELQDILYAAEHVETLRLVIGPGWVVGVYSRTQSVIWTRSARILEVGEFKNEVANWRRPRYEPEAE
jgi:hypothetical protein